MSKYVAIVLFLSVNAIVVAGYIDDSMMRKYATSSLPETWSSKSGGFQARAQPKAPYRPQTRVVPISPKEKEGNLQADLFDVDEIIRAEYDAWAYRYGKSKEDQRFEIFRSNFMLQMDFNRKTGQFHLLNEYGDMTKEEYERAMSETTTSSAYLDVGDVVDRIDDLDNEVKDAILNQVLERRNNAEWDDFSFAMYLQENIVQEQLQYSYEENAEIGNFQEDAPARPQHQIFPMASTVVEAASPEIQNVSQAAVDYRNKKLSSNDGIALKPIRRAFAVGSSFGNPVAPMGSSVGELKIF